MNRDPENYDCTADPIYILFRRVWHWVRLPPGCGLDGDSVVVEDVGEFAEWASETGVGVRIDGDDELVMIPEVFKQYAARNDAEFGPYIESVDHAEAVYLKRGPAEDEAKRLNSRGYRDTEFWVYCVPCKGKLASILAAYPEPGSDQELITAALFQRRGLLWVFLRKMIGFLANIRIR